jgi:hypothetical protein
VGKGYDSVRIGLLDVDGHNFPNLPFMKLSAWHKQKDDMVEIYDGLRASQEAYDLVYSSKVFDFTPDYDYPIYAKDHIKGGTGYGLDNKLLPEIENIYPDYSLYNNKTTAYGFLTRGCPRGCDFCIVGEKEGLLSHKVSDLSGFWQKQKHIKLLDPNLLACKDRISLLQQLIDSKAWIDFTQGLDIRFMTEETAHLIMQCKIKMIHFAWDKEKDSKIIVQKLREFKHITGIPTNKAAVYVLTNFDTTFEFDLERVYKLRDMGFDPYVMIYDKQHAPKQITRLQRWVNGKQIFRTVKSFEDYKTGS